ncbi:complex I subunit 4 family protein [Vallicoccus soli]|uniref:NADH-quinone oxidoreductase subunit M n=1 Tax=Vallicoccus soli TaxID=2339232 RepID=A0A3A3ZE78_9ACTN|nr:NADH-quinone oxidoreductase subunit M [Vallicoccus soli]RJK93425.1 NADH-quinone oxidoreductase subunit M [Vallicoccus soli]
MSGVLALLPALPLAGAVVLLLLPAARRDAAALGLGRGVAAAVLVLAVLARDAPDVDVPWVPALGLRLHLGVDGVSWPLLLLTGALVLLCLQHLVRGLPAPGRPGALVGLLLLLEAGVLATFLAQDLLLFFVAFETVLIPMYFVIAVWGGDGRGSARPAAQVFVLYTLLGSVVMLAGFLLVRARTGTSDLQALAERGGAGMSTTVQVVAFLLVGLGLAVKAPMWPLHTWLPAAHTAAPTVGSVLLAGVLLKLGTYGLVRTALPVLPEGARVLAPYLAALAVVGILWGALACLAQRDLKRLVAYSSVSHMGFVLLGIATLTEAGVNGALFANVAHGLITGLLFLLAGAVKERHGTTDMDELGGGLYARAPRLGGVLALAAVASLGLPGLAGFWGEMLAMLGAYRPAEGLDRGLYLVLMALAGLGTVLAAAYLLRMVRRVAQGRGAAARAERPVLDAGPAEVALWAPLVAATLLLGLWPALLLDVTAEPVRALLGGG